MNFLLINISEKLFLLCSQHLLTRISVEIVRLAHLGVCVSCFCVCIENCCVMLWFKRFRQFANFLSLLKKWGKRKGMF